MTPETTERPAVAAPETKPSSLDRIPLWARIMVPVVVLAGGAAVVASVIATGSPEPATAESLCRSAAKAQLEARERTDIDLSRRFEITSADDAQRVSGTVTFVDDSGTTRYAAVRCIIRADGDTMQVRSVRFSE
ncbi:hypothetical protein [Agromyces sp. NPDC049794]|uniref:hypothetical protein n=1 Tax=unclassified Agromyces TaxID=2639701 RepID=UPI0033D41CDB